MRSRLRANIFGLGERYVAVVFDDEPVETRAGIRARVVERSIVDWLDFRPTMIRGTRQRQKMHDTYQHAVGTAEYRLQSMIAFARDGRHIAHVTRPAKRSARQDVRHFVTGRKGRKHSDARHTDGRRLGRRPQCVNPGESLRPPSNKRSAEDVASANGVYRDNLRSLRAQGLAC